LPSDFDIELDRREVPALKTHKMVLGEGGENLFPAGVADMDFMAPPPVRAALQARLDHGIFGYCKRGLTTAFLVMKPCRMA